jgi:hypothetical protein
VHLGRTFSCYSVAFARQSRFAYDFNVRTHKALL